MDTSLYNSLRKTTYFECIVIIVFRQVAAYWAEQKLSDFAAVVQPFFSEAKADSFSIDFLSMVSNYCTCTCTFFSRLSGYAVTGYL